MLAHALHSYFLFSQVTSRQSSSFPAHTLAALQPLADAMDPAFGRTLLRKSLLSSLLAPAG